MYVGTSAREMFRAPTILLNIRRRRLSGEAQLSHSWGVTRFPVDFEIFLPVLSWKSSYLTCRGGGKFKIFSHIQSLTLTESAISFPIASKRMSRAAQRAANSLFHANFPSPSVTLAVPLWPHPSWKPCPSSVLSQL